MANKNSLLHNILKKKKKKFANMKSLLYNTIIAKRTKKFSKKSQTTQMKLHIPAIYLAFYPTHTYQQ